METNYWSRVLHQRIARRKAIAATGASALGVAFLAACGGSDNNNSNSSSGSSSGASAGSGASTGSASGATGGSGGSGAASNGLITTPVDTTAQAKPGGTVKDFYTAALTHMDALLSNSASTVNLVSVFCYPRLMKYTLVKAPQQNDGSMTEGEAAQSFEASPDGLTYTFKVRPNMLWDSRAPTNHRAIDSSDVMFSWAKFAKLNASAPNFVYDAENAPDAAVESISAPDTSTVVMKLRRPEAALLTLLAGWDQLYIMPKESDGGFDPKTTARGHGPWMLDEFVPSSHMYWTKNPDYYVKDRPFPDRLERNLVPEYATRLAQFKAGNIHTYVAANEDIVQTKKDVPTSVIYQDPLFNSMTSSPNVDFGYEGDSIFRDTRVRQAMSMAIDRESFATIFENVDKFAQAGLDITWKYNTQLSPGWGEAWLDPTDTAKFGEDVKFMQFNPDEAKKLLAEAGHGGGVDFDFYHNQEQTYGAAYGQQVDVYQGFFNDIGMKATMKGLPYSQWLPTIHYGYTPAKYRSGEVKGFTGIALTAERTRYTPAFSVYGLMHPNGDAFHGAVPANGQGLAIDGDPVLNDMLAKWRLETDKNKAQSLGWDAQRYITKNANFIPKPSNSMALRLMWPAIANNYVFNSSSVGRNLWAENNLNWWVDKSKAPFV